MTRQCLVIHISVKVVGLTLAAFSLHWRVKQPLTGKPKHESSHSIMTRNVWWLSTDNIWFLEITGEDNLTVFLLRESEVPWVEAAAEMSRSVTVLDLRAWTYYNLYYKVGEPAIQSVCSPQAVSVWSAFLMPFLPFVYGYPSSSPHAHCTPNKSVPTLCYTHRPGPVCTGPCP